MVETVSTGVVGPADRLGYWNDIIGSTYRGMVVDTSISRFDARLSVWDLGPTRMVRPRSSAATITRHEHRSTMGSERKIIAHFVGQGQIQLTHRGRQARLGAGDMVLCAAEEYYRFDCLTEHELMVVELDGDDLSRRLPDLDDHLARTIPGHNLGSRILGRFLGSLWQEATTPLPPTLARTHSAVLIDLIVGCLASDADEASRTEDPVLQRVREVIMDRLGDFDLGPAMIAEDTGIPLRTLQGMAARGGTTIGQMITDHRLIRGAWLLKSKPCSSVTDIALECGFADPSYFARRFAQRFGTSPKAYRTAH